MLCCWLPTSLQYPDHKSTNIKNEATKWFYDRFRPLYQMIKNGQETMAVVWTHGMDRQSGNATVNIATKMVTLSGGPSLMNHGS
jgi:hypothetical protein